jgi:sugar phosphate isomerase/epimerase
MSGAEAGAPPADIRSLKGVFPFSFGSTSWLFPAGYEENIARAGHLFDEMELLFFESTGLPSAGEIRRMRALGSAAGLGFSVHLPLDIDLASVEEKERTRAGEVVRRALDVSAPLAPTAYILHVKGAASGARGAWRARVDKAFRRLPGDHARFCVETLEWDLREIGDLIFRNGLSICVDTGHCALAGFPLSRMFEAFADRIGMIHLHGVRGGKDHASLAHLDAESAEAVGRFLARGCGKSLVLEVFSIRDYVESLGILETICRPASGAGRALKSAGSPSDQGKGGLPC